jgi:hypothetical protein
MHQIIEQIALLKLAPSQSLHDVPISISACQRGAPAELLHFIRQFSCKSLTF